MIPKIIHYCWFGRHEKPKQVVKYIDSWRKLLPDYEILEWNEDNFNINYNDYVKEAYKSNKFAFVSDVARLYALFHMGGFYLDTDIEMLKSLDDYLNHELLVAFESQTRVMTAFIGSKPNNPIIGNFLKKYEDINPFMKNGAFNTTPNTLYFTDYLCTYGLQLNGRRQVLRSGITVYDLNTFGAFDADNSFHIIDENTVLVHRCMASWGSWIFKLQLRFKQFIANLLGYENYRKLRILVKKKEREDV